MVAIICMKALGKKSPPTNVCFQTVCKTVYKKAKVCYIEEGRIVDLLVYCDQIHLLYFPHLEAQQ